HLALSQARLEPRDPARRFRALLVQAAAHAGDIAVRRVEVLGKCHDALPKAGALAAIGRAERFGLGRRARQLALELRVLYRQRSATRAQSLDLALEDRNLSAAFAQIRRKRR